MPLTLKSLRLGEVAPDFSASTTFGYWDSFHSYIGENHWTILFSHPSAFTPVCTTELAAVAALEDEWERRNTKVVALSCNSLAANYAWHKDIEGLSGSHPKFPIIADESQAIATLYGMLDSLEHDPTNVDPATNVPLTVRSLFIIDPSKKIRLIVTYPATCGRNFKEIIRTLDSLRTSDQYQLFTPANWVPKQSMIVPPYVTTEEAIQRYANVKERFPYLRFADPKYALDNEE